MGWNPRGIGTLARTRIPLVMARVDVPAIEIGRDWVGGLDEEQAAVAATAASRMPMRNDLTIKTHLV